jgi:hypothetical protein
MNARKQYRREQWQDHSITADEYKQLLDQVKDLVEHRGSVTGMPVG